MTASWLLQCFKPVLSVEGTNISESQFIAALDSAPDRATMAASISFHRNTSRTKITLMLTNTNTAV